jgi:hypothetical protein
MDRAGRGEPAGGLVAEHDRIVDGLLDRCGRTYAADAGIPLADMPGPLYQLHVLATLLSARISAGIAVAAARELFGAGCRSPAAMARANTASIAGPTVSVWRPSRRRKFGGFRWAVKGRAAVSHRRALGGN